MQKTRADRTVTFLSTPPSRVATGYIGINEYAVKVSIHATLAGGDVTLALKFPSALVSIHATLAGGDL